MTIVPLPMAIEPDDFRHRPGGDLIADSTELSSMLQDGIFESDNFFSVPFLVRPWYIAFFELQALSALSTSYALLNALTLSVRVGVTLTLLIEPSIAASERRRTTSVNQSTLDLTFGSLDNRSLTSSAGFAVSTTVLKFTNGDKADLQSL